MSSDNLILLKKLFIYYFDKNKTFPILKSNIENGYACVVTWENFLKSPQFYMDKAFEHKRSTPESRIIKLL